MSFSGVQTLRQEQYCHICRKWSSLLIKDETLDKKHSWGKVGGWKGRLWGSRIIEAGIGAKDKLNHAFWCMKSWIFNEKYCIYCCISYKKKFVDNSILKLYQLDNIFCSKTLNLKFGVFLSKKSRKQQVFLFKYIGGLRLKVFWLSLVQILIQLLKNEKQKQLKYL